MKWKKKTKKKEKKKEKKKVPRCEWRGVRETAEVSGEQKSGYSSVALLLVIS